MLMETYTGGEIVKKAVLMVVMVLLLGSLSLSTVIIGDGFLLGFGRHVDHDLNKPVRSFFGVSWGLGMRYQAYFGEGLTPGLNAYWGVDTVLLLVPNKVNLGAELAIRLGTSSFLNIGGSVGFSFLGAGLYAMGPLEIEGETFEPRLSYMFPLRLHLAIVF